MFEACKITKKLILRKEYFGGILVDTGLSKRRFLKPDEYEQKKQELLEAQSKGAWVRFFDATDRGYPLLTNAGSSPIDMHLELTKRCNCSCKHCFAESNSARWTGREISLSELKDIIRQFSDNGGSYIRLTGGEPTLRHDFFDIVDFINDQGVMWGLNTNGLFGEEKLEAILSSGLKDIRVSLDGPEEINDEIRGKGGYRQVMQTMKRIAEYNSGAKQPIENIINVVLMKSNVGSIEEMVQLAQDCRSKISFGLLRVVGRARRDEMLSPQRVAEASYKIQSLRARLGLPKGMVRTNYDIFCDPGASDRLAPFPFDNAACGLGAGGFTLDAFGRITACGYLVSLDDQRFIGNDIRGLDLLDVWHTSEVLLEARKVRRHSCKGCEYHIVKCNGGCPVMAYVFEGKMDGRDPYCVRQQDIQKIIGRLPK